MEDLSDEENEIEDLVVFCWDYLRPELTHV